MKILHGDKHKDRINLSEPKPARERPTCPKHLSKEARKEWHRIVPELESLGLLSKMDRAALAAYCQAYGRWVEAQENLRDEGTLYETARGNVITNPRLWVANKALEQMHKFLTEFGMTPASRTRISTGGFGEDEDPMEAVLRRNRNN
jgi:P27 family predicted phage terminase small subunit